jgi:metallo-beta-lactamase family protein
MKLKFCGAAREVTGSCHLITLNNGLKVLLDCGLYQGYGPEMESFNGTWLFDPKEIDILILSHAHIDHTGRVPKLVKDGFNGQIFSTHATRDLSSLMLLDSAGIQEKDAEFFNKRMQKAGKSERREPLYTTKDIAKVMGLFVCYGYNKMFSIDKDIKVIFKDSGHILGSASVTMEITENGKTTTLGFTGDIGRPNRPILRDPDPMPICDYIICESTYGDTLHDSAPEEVEKFMETVRETCIGNGGKVIVPAFSVGRTQEIIYMLDQLESKGLLPKVKVYVDSPLSVDATDVFINHPECFDENLHEYLLKDPNPFGFKSLTYIRDVEESKALNFTKEPCVIVSSSGMANAGRVKHHLANNIENPNNTVLIVGYASDDTPAGKLRNGEKILKLFGKFLEVRSKVVVMDSFSAHGDQKEMLDYMQNQTKLKQIFLVHGIYERQMIWKDAINKKMNVNNIEIPSLGNEYDLN